MKESVFYRHTHKQQFPVSYLFLELLARSAEKSESGTLLDVIAPVLTALGQKPPFKEEFLADILREVLEIKKDKEQASAKRSGPAPKGRSVGSELSKWIGGLDIEEALLMSCDYDYDKAADLYCNKPVKVVDSIISLRAQQEWQRAMVVFESVVFGTGGKMKGGTSDSTSVMTAASENSQREMESKLKSLGF